MSKKNNNSILLLGAAGVAALAFYSTGKKTTSSAADPKFVAAVTQDKTKLDNIGILLQEMKAKGITNKYTQAAILSIISKESEFIPQAENLNYTSAQLQKVFALTKDEADKLAHKPELIANRVYGGKGGNAADEGYKYRGMGFVSGEIDQDNIGYNQVTFKNTYKRLGDQTGLDLVNHPELLLLPGPAAKVAVQYFLNGIADGQKLNKLKKYNAIGVNDFKTLKDAVGAIYNINAGWGSTDKKLLADVTGGLKKATTRAPALFILVHHVA